MKFRRFDNFIWITCLVIVVTLGWSSTSVAQKSTDTISTVVIDSAPKKLYSELYSDETGNQFMVEIYEEPQEGENLIHFRSFKNGKIIGRKSQALADAHNFTFFIDETEQRIMRQDTEQMLYNVLKKLMEESDQKLKTNLEDLFDQEKMEAFHETDDWGKRNQIVNELDDFRFRYLGKRLIYQNQSDTLSKEEYNTIHSDIAKKILSVEETRFTTLPMAEKLCDDIRNEKNISREKLDYMNDIDAYLHEMRRIYEKAS